MSKTKKEIKKIKGEFFKTVSTLIVSAFGLIAALAWNNAITEIIKQYLKPGQTVLSWILYAVLVTLLAVLVTVYLSRVAERFKEEKERGK